MTLQVDTSTKRTAEKMEFETTIATSQGESVVLVSIFVSAPSMNIANALHKILLRRVKFAVEETV